jgi:hypothetical protein
MIGRANYAWARQEVAITGASLPSEPGAPALPSQAVLVGVPAHQMVRLEILHTEYQTVPGTHQLCTDKLLPPQPDEATEYQYDRPERIKTIYQTEKIGYSPAVAAKILQLGFVRDQAVAQLAIYPAQYLPDHKTLRVTSAL